MEAFRVNEMKESFERFEKAAMRRHEESQWIWNVVKDMELKRENKGDIEKAFAETESPLGYYFARQLCNEWKSRERFDYMKKSSDGGCSWGQVQYASYFHSSNSRVFVEKELELREKAVAQNNPRAIWCRGEEHEEKVEYEEALADYRLAAELGWQGARRRLSVMFYYGRGVDKDLVQAVYWGSKVENGYLWEALGDAMKAWNDKVENLGRDFNQLAMEIGKGLYWYQHGTKKWNGRGEKTKEFGIKCLDYYCEMIELQQEAIFLFLLFWNKMTGVKEPGRMIGQMVWKGQYDCLVKDFGDDKEEEERGVKRLKK